MHRLRNMACVRGIGPYQLGLRRDRGVRLVAPTAQRLRRDPQILGDLFDRLGLRRIRAARFGQQPDGLRLELRRVSRSFCHGSIISHRVRGNAEQKSVHITTHPIAGEIILEGYLLRVRGWGEKSCTSVCLRGWRASWHPARQKQNRRREKQENQCWIGF